MATSPFLTLPAELRLRIYELALQQEGDSSTITLSFNNKTQSLIRNSSSTNPKTKNSLALTTLTHLIRNESLPTYTSLHTLHLKTHILGQNLLLIAGQPSNPANLTAPLHIFRTWLSWSGHHNTSIKIDLGVWYTWWERATPEIVVPSAKRFVEVVRRSNRNAKVTFAVTVEWCAIPMTKSAFEVHLPLWDLEDAKRRVAKYISEQRDWMEAQTTRYCLLENLEICRTKFDRLFKLLLEEEVEK